MSFTITNWNIGENIDWYVRIAVSGGSISVKLYQTQALAEAGDPSSAYAYNDGVQAGTDVEITLSPMGSNTLTFFQEEFAWHLWLTGSLLDTTSILKVGHFTDLPEIRHAIYVNEDLISLRAKAAIDLHTHAKLPRSLQLGPHYPTVRIGDLIRVTSTDRGVTEIGQVDDRVLSYSVGNDGAVTMSDSSIVLMRYMGIRRE